MGDFGPDFGARISKHLKLRGCWASYNFREVSLLRGPSTKFSGRHAPNVAPVYKSPLTDFPLAARVEPDECRGQSQGSLEP